MCVNDETVPCAMRKKKKKLPCLVVYSTCDRRLVVFSQQIKDKWETRHGNIKICILFSISIKRFGCTTISPDRL